MKYIQNKRVAYAREHHQRSVVLAAGRQSELDLVNEIVSMHFRFCFLVFHFFLYSLERVR